jgi:hypothetical protein
MPLDMALNRRAITATPPPAPTPAPAPEPAGAFRADAIGWKPVAGGRAGLEVKYSTAASWLDAAAKNYCLDPLRVALQAALAGNDVLRAARAALTHQRQVSATMEAEQSRIREELASLEERRSACLSDPEAAGTVAKELRTIEDRRRRLESDAQMLTRSLEGVNAVAAAKMAAARVVYNTEVQRQLEAAYGRLRGREQELLADLGREALAELFVLKYSQSLLAASSYLRGQCQPVYDDLLASATSAVPDG